LYKRAENDKLIKRVDDQRQRRAHRPVVLRES
jgi:hypothetical protein